MEIEHRIRFGQEISFLDLVMTLDKAEVPYSEVAVSSDGNTVDLVWNTEVR